MKKFALLILTVFMTVSLFAQNAKSTGLTDKDVQNFAKHFNAITEDMENALGDIEDANYLTVKAEYQKAEKILAKYGFTGTNAVEKYAMIARCFAVLSVEKSGVLEMYKAMGMEGMDPMAAQRPYINQKDYEVVDRNWDAIAKAVDYEGGQEEAEEESIFDRKRQKQEEDDYQAQVGDMMSSLMGMLANDGLKKNGLDFSSKKTKGKEAEINELKSYTKKFAAGKKDVGLLYKKYDARNASKWKLMAKYKSTDFMPDDGLFFTSSIDDDNYFRFSTSGATVVLNNDWNTDSSWAADSWEIYHMEDADDMAYEVVFHTKKGIIHFFWKGDKAVLENDAFKLEGSGVYSAG